MLGLAWYFRRGAKASRDGVPASAEAMPPLVPSFLIGFVVFALMASLGLIPGPVAAVAREAARFLLLVAIVALGLRISPRNFLSMDCKLIVAIFCQSLLLALFTFTIVWARGP